MKFLRKSTATLINVGPFVDSTDFVTLKTALTISSNHAELYKAAATSATDISGRTWTHLTSGVYSLALLSGDLDTIGPLLIHIHATAAVPLRFEANVLAAASYDALVAGSALFAADAQQIASSANAAAMVGYSAGSGMELVTVGNSSTSILVTTNLTSAVNSFYAGRTLLFVTGALAGQAASITGYLGATKQLAVSALTSAPSNGDLAVIL